MRYYLYGLPERILTIRVPAKAPKYIVPVIIFMLYFVISPYIMPARVVTIGNLTRLALFGLFILNFFYKQEKIPRFGLTIIFLVFLFLSDLHHGNIALVAPWRPLVGYAWGILINSSLGLIILLQFYTKSWDRLMEILKVLILVVTIFYSLFGLYQIISGRKLVDYAKMGANYGEAAGGRYLQQTQRLIGLPGGGGAMLLPCLGFLTAPFFLKEKRKLISLLFFLNTLAMILTFSRNSYIAFMAMLAVGLFLILRRWNISRARKIQNATIVLLIGGLAVFVFFTLGLPYLRQTGEIGRFISPDNIIRRLQWWGLSLDLIGNYVFFGIGHGTDLSFEFWRHTGTYITPHNFIIAWIMRMGLIQTIIILCLILRQIYLLFRYLRVPLSPSTYWVGFSLIIAYVGILVSSLAGSDPQHCVILMAAISHAYLKFAPKAEKASYRKFFR